MGSTWDEMVLAICRPPRDAYTTADLVGGTTGRFTASGRAYTREDFAVRNPRGHLLQLSLYEPAASNTSPTRPWGSTAAAAGGSGARLGGGGGGGIGGGYGSSPERGAPPPPPPPPVVVYCHCNSGSRRDAEEVLHLLLPRGLAVLALDFAGSGVSEGEYVTLGAHEVDDLAAAIGALRARRGGARLAVGLWGRSMGAATALLYAARDPRVSALVLDSPFASLPDLMVDLVAGQRLPVPVPRALTRAALALMRRSVSKRAGFDVSAVVPAAAAPTCFAPALFGAAPDDAFIPVAHTRRLVARYAGDAALVEFEGGHNSVRPGGWYASGLAFLAAVLLGERGGGGGSTGGAGATAAAAAAVAAATLATPPPPRPFAARGGRLPVADPADLAAAAAFEGSVNRAGADAGHPYGGAALAAAHAGSEAGAAAAAPGARRRGAGAGLTPADLFPAALVGGGRTPAQAEAAMLAAALADSLAVGGGGRRSPSPPAARGRRSRRASPGRASPPPPPPPPGQQQPHPARLPARPRDPGDVHWPPAAAAAGPAYSPAPSTAAATASGTPSPVRSHFTVAPAHLGLQSPGGGGGGHGGAAAAAAAPRPPRSPARMTPPPGRPAASRPSPSLTPDQARLASFFGAQTPPPPAAKAGGRSPGGGRAPAVVPIVAATSPRSDGRVASPPPSHRHPPPLSAERAARAAAAAAGAGAEAARAARRNSSAGGGGGV